MQRGHEADALIVESGGEVSRGCEGFPFPIHQGSHRKKACQVFESGGIGPGAASPFGGGTRGEQEREWQSREFATG